MLESAEQMRKNSLHNLEVNLDELNRITGEMRDRSSKGYFYADDINIIDPHVAIYLLALGYNVFLKETTGLYKIGWLTPCTIPAKVVRGNFTLHRA